MINSRCFDGISKSLGQELESEVSKNSYEATGKNTEDHRRTCVYSLQLLRLSGEECAGVADRAVSVLCE